MYKASFDLTEVICELKKRDINYSCCILYREEYIIQYDNGWICSLSYNRLTSKFHFYGKYHVSFKMKRKRLGEILKLIDLSRDRKMRNKVGLLFALAYRKNKMMESEDPGDPGNPEGSILSILPKDVLIIILNIAFMKV
jgi:hypothetical protein